MHGDEAIRQIRKLDFHVIIIALTGNAFEEEKQNLFTAGADAFLSKPTNILQLKKTIQENFITRSMPDPFPEE
jgi:CheY-like chemotaxis protein